MDTFEKPYWPRRLVAIWISSLSRDAVRLGDVLALWPDPVQHLQKIEGGSVRRPDDAPPEPEATRPHGPTDPRAPVETVEQERDRRIRRFSQAEARRWYQVGIDRVLLAAGWRGVVGFVENQERSRTKSTKAVAQTARVRLVDEKPVVKSESDCRSATG
jgi:hypothetical protein